MAWADPQSFLLSPGTTIENGKIVRGYCLELEKDVLKNDNIGKLVNYIGNAIVYYKDGTTATKSFADLYNHEIRDIIPYNSPEHISFVFDTDTVDKIIIDDTGVILTRKMTADETTANKLDTIKAAAQRIIAMEKQGIPHEGIQILSWEKQKAKPDFAETEDGISVAYIPKDQTEYTTTYDAGSGILSSDGILILIDGMTQNNTYGKKPSFLLFTHYHSDHINSADIDRILKTMPENTYLFLPRPELVTSQENKAFQTVIENIQTGNLNARVDKNEDDIIKIASSNMFLPKADAIQDIGDFTWYRYFLSRDTILDVFNNNHPKNTNMDGNIYRFTQINPNHPEKSISQLIMGDFDNTAGLENLVSSMAEKQKEKFGLLEKRSLLDIELLELEQQRDSIIKRLESRQSLIERSDIYPLFFKMFVLPEFEQGTTELVFLISDKESEIGAIDEQLALFPSLQADIVKWPHHAHVFTEKDKEILIRFDELVNPSYYIYQFHQTQSEDAFTNFINTLPFKDKFLNSAEKPVHIFSYLRLLDGGIQLSAACNQKNNFVEGEQL